MHEPLISIIVPIYNSEKFLGRCLDSIISQTYKNWELLLINDGSIDNSLMICNNYASKNTRIRVFNKPNEGVSSARNLGIKNAQGKWLTFIDSDDWVESDYLINFSQKYDLSLQGFYNGLSLVRYKSSIVTCNPGAEYLFNGYVNGPYCKLFKSEIISKYNLSFDLNLSFGEDILFLMQYIIYCKSMNISNYCGYHYTIENINSLTRQKRCFNNVYLQYTKHMKYYEKIMSGTKYAEHVMHKQTLGMLTYFTNDYGIRYKDIKKDAFLYYYYNTFLHAIDKVYIILFPVLPSKLRRLIIKLLYKICL